MDTSIIIASIGWILILAGVAVSFVAIVAMTVAVFKTLRRRPDRFRGGGLIMLGPIPIIFGTDKEAMKFLIILTIVLIIVMLAFILALRIFLTSMLGGGID